MTPLAGSVQEDSHGLLHGYGFAIMRVKISKMQLPFRSEKTTYTPKYHVLPLLLLGVGAYVGIMLIMPALLTLSLGVLWLLSLFGGPYIIVLVALALLVALTRKIIHDLGLRHPSRTAVVGSVFILACFAIMSAITQLPSGDTSILSSVPYVVVFILPIFGYLLASLITRTNDTIIKIAFPAAFLTCCVLVVYGITMTISLMEQNRLVSPLTVTTEELVDSELAEWMLVPEYTPDGGHLSCSPVQLNGRSYNCGVSYKEHPPFLSNATHQELDRLDAAFDLNKINADIFTAYVYRDTDLAGEYIVGGRCDIESIRRKMQDVLEQGQKQSTAPPIDLRQTGCKSIETPNGITVLKQDRQQTQRGRAPAYFAYVGSTAIVIYLPTEGHDSSYDVQKSKLYLADPALQKEILQFIDGLSSVRR